MVLKMIERILEILKIKNLSPAQFADLIGVQRSSISHLISGRNKPSLEFIQRILKTFPEINTDWMLSGKGAVMNNENYLNEEVNPAMDLFQPEQLNKEKIPEPKKPEPEKVQKKRWIDPEGKKIEKIVCFYKDNTFREYLPE
jgi:transcriptional regulator with XRE-family HTH domain